MGALNWLQAFAALYVLAEAVLALNRMTSTTSHAIRAAYVALSSGALAALVSTSASPNLIECALAVSVALFIGADRRKKRIQHGT